MPLNAAGWSNEEDEILVDLVKQQTCLYNISDPSRKNILIRQKAWLEIAQIIQKPVSVEECKKRWRGIRDFYMRTKRVGSVHKAKAGIFSKLGFLDTFTTDMSEDETFIEDEEVEETEPQGIKEEQKVITDNQEYYEIEVVDESSKQKATKAPNNGKEQTMPIKHRRGRKKNLPVPAQVVPPIKILPKPIMISNSKIVRYSTIEENRTPAQRSQVIDKLIEKTLKENTNEIDVFFRSMAASVKKLQPNLIPKVKMEVCNVIAKYEMQSFDKNMQNI